MNEKPVIRKLDIVPLRKAFPDEARDLTPWLAENLDALGDRLGIRLSLEQKEKRVGDFSLDLLCQDGEGQKVIVENQLEQTDHDHLGKLLTYLVNLDAKTAIWVTSDPRQEHQRVIEWLNEASPNDTSFYLVKVEAIKTGDDVISPLFSILAKPDSQSKEIGQEKKEYAAIQKEQLDFWRALLSKRIIKQTAFADRNPRLSNHINVQAGVPKAWFSFSVNANDSYVYLTFKFDKAETTASVFETLTKQRAVIEKEFGETLIWQPQDRNNWNWVGKKFEGRGLRTPEAWPDLQDEMIDAMIRLDEVLRNRLREAYETIK